VGTTGVPATPTVTYAYGTDPNLNEKGRLKTVTDGVGTETYTYDPYLGRVTQVDKVISGTTYTTQYAYNLANEITSITYPSRCVVQQSYDAIGRLCEVAPQTTGCATAASPYATGVAYNVAGQATGFNYGNGVAASFGYTAERFQLQGLSYTKSGQTLFSLSYGYTHPNGGNNGQITSITDNTGTGEAGRSVAYTYDALHRLKSAVTTGSTQFPQWGLSWTYDRYGNRTAQSVTAGSAPSNSVSATTNRITEMGGYTFYYDSDGNLTQDDLYKYKYDAENRMVELRNLSDTLIATYAYDGNSLRVVKVVGSDRTFYIYAGGQMVEEYEDAASNQYNPGTTPGQAGSESASTLIYQHGDHLTTRLTTENNSNEANEQAHYPFGESWYAYGTADPSVLRKYTSYMKDGEASTGRLNYAVFRQHSGRLSRFHSPDVRGGRLWDPQSLNRYPYARNDGINLVDPVGRDYCSFLMANSKPLFDLRGEVALGGGDLYPSVTTESADSLEPQNPPDHQDDCQAANGVWVTSDCWGPSCKDIRNSGGGGGFNMPNTLGGWAGAAEGFQNTQLSYGGAFNPYGTPGTLGSAVIDRPGPITPWGAAPSYTAFTIIWADGSRTDPVPLRDQAYENYLRWLRGWAVPPTHPSVGPLPAPAVTLECSLLQESGGACSYSCSSRGPSMTNMINATVQELRGSCPGAGAITSCPLSIQARESHGNIQITGCGL
jgi:RHS repeat-associated protein